jgi:Tol biopolymer transport system component
MRRNTLFAVPFDPAKLALSGEPTAIVEDAELDPARSKGAFTVSQGGILAYHPGTGTNRSQLVWLDRAGKRLGTLGEPGLIGEPALSPDGKRAAVSVLDAASRIVQIWIYDLASGTGSPFTFGSSPSRFPIWSPDGSRVFFLSSRLDRKIVFVKPAAGTGEEEVLRSEGWTYPTDTSRDGRFLALTHYDRRDGWSVRAFPLTGEKNAEAIASGRMKEPVTRFSPDSRWVAYNSLESSRSEARRPGALLRQRRGGADVRRRGAGGVPRVRSAEGPLQAPVDPQHVLLVLRRRARRREVPRDVPGPHEAGADRARPELARRAPEVTARQPGRRSTTYERSILATFAVPAWRITRCSLARRISSTASTPC